MRGCMRIEFLMRVCDARVDTLLSRLEALSALTKFFHAFPLSVEARRHTRDVTLRPVTWSRKQQGFLDIVADRINIQGSSDLAGGLARWMHITGGHRQNRDYYPCGLSCC